MFALSFMMLFTIAFISTFNLKIMAVEKQVKNLSSTVMLGSSAIVSFSVFYLFYDDLSFVDEANNVFSSYQIYLNLGIELLALWVARTNYERNGNNITSINVTMFLSLLLVPIISYFMTEPLGFSDTLIINYKSQYEMWLFILLMTVLLSGFFAGKLKGHINNWKFLIFTPIILSFTMFLTSKMMQLHNAYFIYGIIALVNAVIFGFIAIGKKEIKNLESKHKKHFMIIALPSIVFVPMNAIVVKIIAVEFITLLKRVAQILTGIIVDKMYNNKNTVNTKDKAIIGLIFCMALALYYFRG